MSREYPWLSMYSCIDATVPGSSSYGPTCMHCTHSPSSYVRNSALEKSAFFFLVASSTAQSRSAFVTKSGSLMAEIHLKSSLCA